MDEEGARMPKLAVQVTSEGLNDLARALQEAGVEPGGLVELDWTTLPNAREIQHRALRHTVWKLGMAIRIAQPRWVENEWLVILLSADEQEEIGELYYDAHGQLIE